MQTQNRIPLASNLVGIPSRIPADNFHSVILGGLIFEIAIKHDILLNAFFMVGRKQIIAYGVINIWLCKEALFNAKVST